MIRRPQRYTLFPYTTLSRSDRDFSLGPRDRRSGRADDGRIRAPLRGTDERIVRIRRSEEYTSELQSRLHLVCRLLLEKKKTLLMMSPLTIREMALIAMTYDV